MAPSTGIKFHTTHNNKKTTTALFTAPFFYLDIVPEGSKSLTPGPHQKQGELRNINSLIHKDMVAFSVTIITTMAVSAKSQMIDLYAVYP